MKKLFISLMLVWCFAAHGATHYIRAGAGGANDGTDWNNAYNAMPATLARGDTYYVADGSYGYYEFEDAVSGTTLITIKKATVADHGTSTGWDNAYGDGQAEFYMMVFETSYWLIDGQGRNTTTWRETGHGFKITKTADNQQLIYCNTSGLTSISLYDIEGTSNASSGPPYETGIYWPVTMTGLTIAHCSFHDVPGDMFQIRGFSNFTAEYNYFARNWQDGTRHGDLFEHDGTGSNFIVRHNYFDACVGTYICGHHTTGNITGYEIYGNVFRATTTGNGIIATLNPGAGGTINNLRVYNNTFVNTTFNSGIHLYNGSSGSGATNNLYYNCESLSFSSVSHDYNWFRLSGTQSESNIQNGSGDPFMDISGEDFRLSGATTAGFTLSAPYNTDPNGVTRAVDGTWDRGAFEYNSGAGSPPTAPSNLAANAVSSSQINLTWDDNSGDEDEFKIEQSTVGGGSGFTQIHATAADVESYSVTSLLPNTTYYFRIRAANEFGNSAYTSEASDTTDPSSPPPASPGGLRLDTNYRRR